MKQQTRPALTPEKAGNSWGRAGRLPTLRACLNFKLVIGSPSPTAIYLFEISFGTSVLVPAKRASHQFALPLVEGGGRGWGWGAGELGSAIAFRSPVLGICAGLAEARRGRLAQCGEERLRVTRRALRGAAHPRLVVLQLPDADTG